jgi:hypothetical protein
MKTFVHLWQCQVEFFLEWEIFQKKFVKNIKHMFNDQQLFMNAVPFMR